MADRHTKIRGSQFRNSELLPEDIKSTNALGTGMDGYVPSYDEATGEFTWIAPSGATLAGLDDVVFDTGTPADDYGIKYDSASGKWKAEALYISFGSGGQVYIGESAGENASADANSVFIGKEAGYGANTGGLTGDNNVFIGRKAGYNNTSGNGGTFIGNEAGLANTIGGSNIFIGTYAGHVNTEGISNIFMGAGAGLSNIDGDYNIFAGYQTGYHNISGNKNIYLGASSAWNATGNSNIAFGEHTGYHISSDHNIFMGYRAGFGISGQSIGGYNIGIGYQSIYGITSGEDNIAIGRYAGKVTNSGFYNVFIGRSAGLDNQDGNNNIFIGQYAGQNNVSGNGNIAIGEGAGADLLGEKNICIGYQAGGLETGSNKLYIHYSNSATPLIYGEFDTPLLRIHGDLYVKDDLFSVGDGTTGAHKKIEANIGQTGDQPALRYNKDTNKWQFSNDGSSFSDIGTGGDSYTEGDGIDISTANVISVDEADFDPSLIPFSATGFDANNIEDAILELDTEKSDTSHTHDDRYYTETEINNLLSAKQDTLTEGNGINISTAEVISVDEADFDASQIPFSATGFDANNIFDAIKEVDSEHYTSSDFDTDFASKYIYDLADVDFDTGTPLDNYILVYDASTGVNKWKASKEVSTDGTLGDNSDDAVPTEKAVKTYIDGKITGSHLETFDDSDLTTANVLTVTHNLGVTYPIVMIYDNNNKVIEPDEIEYSDTNTILVDLSSFSALAGTWHVRIIG